MAPSSCRLCGAASPEWFSAAARAVHRCPACGHIEVPAGLARLPNGQSIYEAEDAIFTADGNAEYYLDDTNMRAATEKAQFVRRFVSGGRLVDVGASYGHFLAAAAGFEAAGFEVSPEAVAFSRREFGVDNRVGSIYEWPAALGEADAITCWDVIEHLEDPVEAVRIMREHLVPGGRIFFSTPDAGALVARLMGARWHYLDPVQHINVFTRRNLVAMLEREGFRVDATRTFGRYYRVRYILNRLGYLHKGKAIGRVVDAASWVIRPAASLTIPIKLGDVMGIAARRT